ncbi:MAG: quinone-dependent dihydroorotate dehydrogenase [Pseudomonadota bacterium]
MTARQVLAKIGARGVRLLPPEEAHVATIRSLKTPFAPRYRVPRHKSLAIDVAGISFPNPIGLAAGFDKNAEVPGPCLKLGFGFVEVGAVTPRAQPGNPSPRVFRLTDDKAVINRYGFNNDGLEVIAGRLKRHRKSSRAGIVGINLGANKDSEDRTEDYVIGIKGLEGLVDFYTVNISSPNTPGLRALQDRASLDDLLARVMLARDDLIQKVPVFLKVAPDLVDRDKEEIAAAVLAAGIDGLIVSNTTIERPETLRGPHTGEKGGLSGAPLFEMSTRVLAEFHQRLGQDMPLIGVGGVGSPRQAYEKILAGASLVQLYTAMIYEGPSLPARIVRALPSFLRTDGFANVADAVGAKAA